jgi:ComF family protein
MVITFMSLIDLLFPKTCLGCGYLGGYICLACRQKLRLIEEDCCLYCQKPSLFGLTHPSCSTRLTIDGCLSLFYYEGLMKKIIKNIKYQLVTEVFNELFITAAPFVINKLGPYKKLVNGFELQPIPLHHHRLGERGFNQAQIIGEFFGKILALPLADFLERKKPTRPLAQLKGRKQRCLKIRGAFVIKDKNDILGKKIILVDDVVTSGSTIKEAGRVFKKNGAARVLVTTMAKG